MLKRNSSLLLSILIAGFSIVAGLAFAVEPASAVQSTSRAETSFNPDDFSISLHPSTQTLDLKPHDTYDGTVNVTNSGKIPVNFTVKVTPYQVSSDEYAPDYTIVNRYTELASWVKVEQIEYHIEPGEVAEVKFHISVPEKAVGGGQYAAIMIYTEDSADPNATVRVASQLAAILYGHIEGDEMNVAGTITDHSFPGLVTGGPLEISASASNTGNVDFTMHQAVTVKNFFTGEEYFGSNSFEADGTLASVHDVVVMPGTTRTDIIVWENTPRIGLYRIEQTIKVLDETITEEKLILFCPIWIIVLVSILVVLLILWVTLDIIKRHRRRPQVF